MPRSLHPDEIAGGRVLQTFKAGERRLYAGDNLTAEEIRAWPHANRVALIEKGYVFVWPKIAVDGLIGGELHVINRGFGKFDVIQGRLLNERPLTKQEAYNLAGKKVDDEENAAAPSVN